MTKLTYATLTLLALTAISPGLRAEPARPGTAAPAAAASVATPPMSLRLNDGSVITGTLKASDLLIETEFGPLKIPVSRIRSMTPGLDANPDFQKKITTYIEKLASSDAAERDASQRELVKLGPSIVSELQKADPDPERKLRIDAIIEEFASQAEDSDNATVVKPLIRLDAVETPDFTAVGRIVPKSFDVATSYGPLTVKLSDIRTASSIQTTAPEEIIKSVSVDGGNFIFARVRESGVKVQRGDRIVVKAEGTLTMTPWGEGSISTPDGAPQFGWYIQNQIANGCLVGRIGKNGPVFKIGSKASFTAEQTGELMLGIAMANGYGGQAFPGKYTVKIRVTPK